MIQNGATENHALQNVQLESYKNGAELLLVSDRNLPRTRRWRLSVRWHADSLLALFVFSRSVTLLWVLEDDPVYCIYCAAVSDSVCVVCPGQRSVNFQYASPEPWTTARNPEPGNIIWSGFPGQEGGGGVLDGE